MVAVTRSRLAQVIPKKIIEPNTLEWSPLLRKRRRDDRQGLISRGCGVLVGHATGRSSAGIYEHGIELALGGGVGASAASSAKVLFASLGRSDSRDTVNEY